MKTKTINTVLKKKIGDWLETIEDEKLRAAAKKDVVVTGGCIASMLLREKVNDYDVYFKTLGTTKAVAEYYLDKFLATRKKNKGIEVPIKLVQETDSFGEQRVKIVVKSAGIASDDDSDATYRYFEGRPPEEAGAYVDEVLDGRDDPEVLGQIDAAYEEAEGKALEDEDKSYRPVFMSTNAITLSGKIQIVLRFYGKPDKIHENYDFVHCTNYWTWEDGLHLRKAALEHLLTKELRYVGSKYPVCSVIRVRKFVQRGWTINAGQLVKMCFQISQLDLTDLKILEEQLTGVDVAYFMQVIEMLREKDKTKVDAAYLLEIIDRMF